MATDRDLGIDWRAPSGFRPKAPTQQEVNQYRAAHRPPMYSREAPIAPSRAEAQAPALPPGQAREPGPGRHSAVSNAPGSPWPVVGRRASATERIQADLNHVALPLAARQIWFEMQGQCQTERELANVKARLEYTLGANPRISEADLRQSCQWSLEALRATYEAGPPPAAPPATVTSSWQSPWGSPTPPLPAPAVAPTPATRALEAGITSPVTAAAPPATPASPAPAVAPLPYSDWLKQNYRVVVPNESHYRKYLKATGQE